LATRDRNPARTTDAAPASDHIGSARAVGGC